MPKRISCSIEQNDVLQKLPRSDKFAEENLNFISKMEKFGDLDLNDFKGMIKSKTVKMTEKVKLEVLLRWTRQDDERKKFLGKVLESIELDNVPVECLHHLLENEPLIKENFAIYKIISSYMLKALKVGTRPLGDGGMEIILFDEESGFLQCFNPRANTWRQMHKMHDEMIEDCFSAVLLDDHIYVLMEYKSVYRLQYSDEAATWEQMADMIEDHGTFCQATVVAGQIYVIGCNEGVKTQVAEKYDPATDQWTKLVGKPQSSEWFSLLTIGGKIYSFGGELNGKELNVVYRFDPLLSSWTDMKPMKEAKTCVAAVELDGKAYVLGGLDEHDSLRSFDCYDVDMDEWTSLSPMKIARSSLRAFAVDSFIYAVGGNGWSHDSIEKYNVEKNEWEMVSIPNEMKLRIRTSVNVHFQNLTNR